MFSVDVESIWWEDLRAAYVLAQPGFSANLNIWVERFNNITDFGLFILYTMQVAKRNLVFFGFNSFQEWFIFVWLEWWRCSSRWRWEVWLSTSCTSPWYTGWCWCVVHVGLTCGETPLAIKGMCRTFHTFHGW